MCGEDPDYEMEPSTPPTLPLNSPSIDSPPPLPPPQPPLGYVPPPHTSKFETVWSNQLTTPTINPFVPPTPVGPTQTIPDHLDIFQLFFTPELFELICNASNKYALEVMGPEKYAGWTPLTKEDIRAYYGFQLLMGLDPKPSISDYWSRDPAYHNATIADRISRDRYREISRYLHFADNLSLVPPGNPGYDRLGKVRPLLEYLQDRFKSAYNPGEHLAVDEAMIKFQGRSMLKQYMPLKPIKRGIKVWVLGDSHNGYFSRLQITLGGRAAKRSMGWVLEL